MKLITLLSLATTAAAARTKAGKDACTALASTLQIANTTVTASTYLQAGTNFTIPNAHITCTQSAAVNVPLCRVQMTTTTSSSSRVVTELWLPDSYTSSRRVASTGNGGLNGCIDYNNLQYLSSLGFAIIGSDNGHTGMTGVPFLNQPEVINDFAHRAIHTEAVLAKQVAKSYYGVEHNKSYYVGCSTGGRQGFKAIQTYPADFDGVLAGAPAIDFNHLIAWSAVLSVAGGAPGSAGYLSATLLEKVRLDAIAQCDALDGVTNSIIDEPNNCNYTPSASLNLTPAQKATVDVYFNPIYDAAGNVAYPRLDPGTPFAAMIFGGSFFFFSSDWYKYAVYNTSTLNLSAFNLKTYLADTDAINPGGIAAWAPDKLAPFAARGGKVLTYHGRADQLISGANSIRWFETVKAQFGSKSMNEFYRFFSVPGMDHCAGGSGTGMFGQSGSANAVPADNKHNAVLALVDWVEKGEAPKEIIGTNTDTGATRRLCAYPANSVLKKGGDKTKAEDWSCVSESKKSGKV